MKTIRWKWAWAAVALSMVTVGCAAEMADAEGAEVDGADGETGMAEEALFGEVVLPTSAICGNVYPSLAGSMRDVALREPAEGYFATAVDGGGGDVLFMREHIDTHEKIALVDLGDGRVALLDRSCHFFSAVSGGGGAVMSDKTWLGGWETFTLEPQDTGARVRLRASSGHYLVAGPTGALLATGSTPFDLILIELDRPRRVAMHNGGFNPGETNQFLVPDDGYLGYSARIDSNSTFELVELGLGEWAIRNRGEYLRACDGGGGCLSVDRFRIGTHERFQLIDNGAIGQEAIRVRTYDGHWWREYPGGIMATALSSLYAAVFVVIDLDSPPLQAIRSELNGKYVRAVPDGALKADASLMQDWEKYGVIQRGWDSAGRRRISLRNHHGRFLRAAGGGGGALLADAWHADTHEIFTVIPAGDGRVALRTHGGWYVGVAADGTVRADRSSLVGAALFRLVTPRPTFQAITTGTVTTRTF